MSRKNDLVDLIEKRIFEKTQEIQEQWLTPKNTTTKHFFLDDLLPQEICEEIYDAFPRDAKGFVSKSSFREQKKTAKNLKIYDSILSDITYALQAPRILALISKITAMDKLEPDPQLYAGGLSMMFKSDYLNPHIDNSHDAKREKYRRLNLLYYASPAWKVENGGNLELWDSHVNTPVTLTSQFNRLIVMETNRTSWHSVSPVNIDAPRCCVSNYYFSEESPCGEHYFHVTSFTGRPEEKVKRLISIADNALRNIVSKVLKLGRGKDEINILEN